MEKRDNLDYVVEKCTVKELLVDKFISPLVQADEFDFTDCYWKLNQIWDKNKASSYFKELLNSVKSSLSKNSELPDDYKQFVGFLGLHDTSYDVDYTVRYNDAYYVHKPNTYYVCEVLEGGLNLLYIVLFMRSVCRAFDDLEQHPNDFYSNERIISKINEYKSALWFADSGNEMRPRLFTTTKDNFGDQNTSFNALYKDGVGMSQAVLFNSYYYVIYKEFYDLSASLFTSQYSLEQVLAFLDAILNHLSFVVFRSTDGLLIMNTQKALILREEDAGLSLKYNQEHNDSIPLENLYSLLPNEKNHSR